MSGGTIGTPITGGIAGSVGIAPPLTATWLSLDKYATIVAPALAPPHFFGVYSDAAFPITDTCDTVVPRHGWQYSENVSREEIADAIREAEETIANYMGYNLAPTFIRNEVHPYPRPYDPIYVGSGGLNTKGLGKSVQPKFGKYMINSGVRTVTYIGTATNAGGSLVYSDANGDGAIDTATITYATTETELCEIKAYAPDTDGYPEWEIRQPVQKYLSGGNVVFVFRVWQLVNPEIDARYPDGTQFRAQDMNSTANLLDSVDIYREHIDNTIATARFFWESDCSYCGGTGCESCTVTYQDGCAFVRGVGSGLLVPKPATYDSDSGTWLSTAWSVSRDPDQVRVSYYAGDISERYLNGRSCDPLKDIYAKAIAYMATARLGKSICSCAGPSKFFDELRTDVALSSRASGDSYRVSYKDLDNPFGTRLGEVLAWRILGKSMRERVEEVAVI